MKYPQGTHGSTRRVLTALAGVPFSSASAYGLNVNGSTASSASRTVKSPTYRASTACILQYGTCPAASVGLRHAHAAKLCGRRDRRGRGKAGGSHVECARSERVRKESGAEQR